MDQKTMKDFNPYAVALYNSKLFERFKSISANPHETFTDLWNLSELFKFIETNFVELHNRSNMLNILAILHNTIRLEIATTCRTSDKINIGTYILRLLNRYEGNEDNQRIVLQILYQALKSIKEEDINVIEISVELFHTLTNLLFECEKRLAANTLSCLRMYVNLFRRPDQIEMIWDKIVQFHRNANITHKVSSILVTLIAEFLEHMNDFYKNDVFIEIVQLLLLSTDREERKCAIYLLKRIIPIIICHAKSVSSWEVDNSTILSSSWNAYITIFENLEEKQSHLILPALETIKHINLSPIWMQLLYKQLLQHNNSLVLRWTITYILENFKSGDLSKVLIKHFLNAVNSTNLYNYDNFCIPRDKLNIFLNCNLSEFLNIFGDINWKSVPLHFWLNEMDKNLWETHEPSIEILMKIAARVRALQNKFIRFKTIELFEKKFDNQIKLLNIAEYLKLIETLYNVLDYFENYEMVLTIFKNKSNAKFEIKITQRVYEILSLTIENHVDVQNAFIEAFSDIPAEDHDFFRLLVIFDFNSTEKQIEFCHTMYAIDLLTEDLHSEFKKGTNKPIIWHEKTIDYFILRFKSFEELFKEGFNPVELLETIGWKAVKHLSELALVDLLDLNILYAFVKALVKYKRYSGNYSTVLMNLLLYSKRLPEKVMNDFVQKLLNADIDDFKVLSVIFTLKLAFKNVEEIVKRLILSEPTTGDARIEERYAYEHRIKVPSFHIRQDAIAHFKQFGDSSLLCCLIDYLLRLNDHFSAKKPRYFENSYEHRIKLRIAIAIMQISKGMTWSSEHVFAVLSQNNQLNVTYLYERIISSSSTSKNIIEYLAEITKHSASQQVSIVSICNAYCSINWISMNKIDKLKIVEMLLPLTMGANFQTRLYSQLVLYKLLEKNGSILSNQKTVVAAIVSTIGDQLNDLLHDIRIDINIENIFRYDIVLYVTNAPFDELTFDCTLKSEFELKYSKSKDIFCRKIVATMKTEDSKKDKSLLDNLNVQRKMNPDTDIIAPEELISYPECQNKKNIEDNIIVVASLIDKLPNLGGIARTCEVLGIKNFIMNSLKYVNSIEFKTLSMSAENGLNINEVKPENLMEFLIQKQIEGFEIVGAEQTANSETFVDFKFPRKCIILLGHEKEGIPSNLISILDHTVEIPQFGLVRSLNVHVTGALFIWEYCKQHIIQK